MSKTIYCTEPECGRVAVYTYDNDKACCGEHQTTVMHHMEAMGRVGPYVDNPVVLTPIPHVPPVAVDWPLLANRYKQEADSLRAQLLEEQAKREFAEGEVSVLMAQVKHTTDELGALKQILDRG
jgi:hypothetical protein